MTILKSTLFINENLKIYAKISVVGKKSRLQVDNVLL